MPRWLVEKFIDDNWNEKETKKNWEKV